MTPLTNELLHPSTPPTGQPAATANFAKSIFQQSQLPHMSLKNIVYRIMSVCFELNLFLFFVFFLMCTGRCGHVQSYGKKQPPCVHVVYQVLRENLVTNANDRRPGEICRAGQTSFFGLKIQNQQIFCGGKKKSNHF